MNEPIHAIDHLATFNGLFKSANPEVWCTDPKNPETLQLPLIHVVSLTSVASYDVKKHFTEKIGKAMKYNNFKEADIENCHRIRDLNKRLFMYCITFRLPYEVAMGTVVEPEGPEPKKKKRKMDKRSRHNDDNNQ